MLGALVGDAAGATLEFCHKDITEEMALEAMKMPGGGTIGVGPGQITDDGELTLALWNSLNVCNGSGITSFPTAAVAKGYGDWYNSNPFDMGGTCQCAFDYYFEFFKMRSDKKSIEECIAAVKEENSGSEANGALMRASAIPAWFIKNSHTNIEFAVECAKQDARLSHPNIVCQEVNAIYVFAITHLLQGVGCKEVLELTDTFVLKNCKSEKVKKWYFEESLDISSLKCTRQIGHVRWGFVLAIYFLRNPEISFEEAIKITLMKGGDTDTNAAIVGGMVGAYHQIPEYMLNPVISFDCTVGSSRYFIRPAKYSVKKVLSS
jgi:ADP-ribosylglycohydrolase